MAKTRTKTRWTETGRRRWTAEYAEEVLEALRRSGLPASRFAAEHGLKVERLRRWQHRLRGAARNRRRSATDPAKTRPVGFAELGLISGRVVTGPRQYEIVLLNGRVIRVDASFDAAALRQLVGILEADSEC